MQIEEELRAAEIADRQKQIAAPPVTPTRRRSLPQKH